MKTSVEIDPHCSLTAEKKAFIATASTLLLMQNATGHPAAYSSTVSSLKKMEPRNTFVNGVPHLIQNCVNWYFAINLRSQWCSLRVAQSKKVLTGSMTCMFFVEDYVHMAIATASSGYNSWWTIGIDFDGLPPRHSFSLSSVDFIARSKAVVVSPGSIRYFFLAIGLGIVTEQSNLSCFFPLQKICKNK